VLFGALEFWWQRQNQNYLVLFGVFEFWWQRKKYLVLFGALEFWSFGGKRKTIIII